MVEHSGRTLKSPSTQTVVSPGRARVHGKMQLEGGAQENPVIGLVRALDRSLREPRTAQREWGRGLGRTGARPGGPGRRGLEKQWMQFRGTPGLKLAKPGGSGPRSFRDQVLDTGWDC